ncbi:MAG TPA: aldo/keto reductase [Polyangiaceae bacterium]|nr:aldo/keto reductase [Polyangiaceae bacterium]
MPVDDDIVGRRAATTSRVARATESGMSRIGLGLAALGRPGYINLGHGADLPAGHDVVAMEAHAHRVLDVAWASGVRYFDAARSYGRAEDFLGTWLRQRDIAPADVVVGSKWGYIYTAAWRTDAMVHEVKDHSLGTLRRQIGESRDRLGDYLDLYQIHSATLESGVLDDEAVLDELARLRRSGLRVGLTVSGVRQSDTIRRALEVERDGQRLFSAVQATWNLLERSAEAALGEAHQAGVFVIVKEALANGTLTERNDDPAIASRVDILRAEGVRLGVGMDAVALAAAIAQPWAGLVLSGAATAEQLRSNLRALDCTWDDEIDARLDALVLDPKDYWARRSRLPWT